MLYCLGVNQSDEYNKIAKNSKSRYAYNFKLSPQDTHISVMLSELKWPSVKQRIIFLTVVMVFKIKNSATPKYMSACNTLLDHQPLVTSMWVRHTLNPSSQLELATGTGYPQQSVSWLTSNLLRELAFIIILFRINEIIFRTNDKRNNISHKRNIISYKRPNIRYKRNNISYKQKITTTPQYGAHKGDRKTKE